MRIYKDVFTGTHPRSAARAPARSEAVHCGDLLLLGDELFSDTYPMKETDDLVYEVEGKFVVEREGDYGISANADEDAGEGAAGEGVEKGEKRVINIVSAHRLQETGFDKV